MALAVITIIFIFMSWKGDSTSPRAEDTPPLAPRESIFEYYGWFLVDYSEPTPALQRIRTYTNTAFAAVPLQAKILTELGFKHIVYSLAFTDGAVLDQLEKEMSTPIPELYGVKLYATGIPNYREKYFAIYRIKLEELKRSLEEDGVLDAIDVFYLADEPAIRRTIYPDQEFLDRLVAEFKRVFKDKKTTMVFAQYPEPRDPRAVWAGPHFAVPPALDIVGVDPYINPKKVSCDTESIRSWLYEKNPATNINWAKQFKKPIIVIGDAQIRDGKALDFCYPQATFDILKADKDVAGLIWYQYDKSYKETSDFGELSGGANNPEFVGMIENLGRK